MWRTLGARHVQWDPKNQPASGTNMGLFKRDKEKDRFYLLPGMGGRALRRKKLMMLMWALAAGLIVSACMAGAFYLMNSHGPTGR